MYARISPRSFLLSRANSCATTTRSVHAYISARPRPANSISALDSRNSWICSWFKCSAFCIVNCIRPKHAATPSFMLMLHWNQRRFHAHLALDNSILAGALAAMLEWVLTLRAAVTTPRGVKYGPPLAKESDALFFMRRQLGALIDAKHHDHGVSRGGGHAGFAVETIVCRLETGPWPAPLSLI